MTSVIFSTPRSAENEGRMERFRMNLKKLLEQNSTLAAGGLFIGSVLKDPSGSIHPTFSILVQSWEIAGDELREAAKRVFVKRRFDGLSAIGLE